LLLKYNTIWNTLFTVENIQQAMKDMGKYIELRNYKQFVIDKTLIEHIFSRIENLPLNLGEVFTFLKLFYGDRVPDITRLALIFGLSGDLLDGNLSERIKKRFDTNNPSKNLVSASELTEKTETKFSAHDLGYDITKQQTSIERIMNIIEERSSEIDGNITSNVSEIVRQDNMQIKSMPQPEKPKTLRRFWNKMTRRGGRKHKQLSKQIRRNKRNKRNTNKFRFKNNRG